MASTPPFLGGFQIKDSRSGGKSLVLSDADGKQTQFQVTPEIIFQLAANLPRYANQLASRLGIADPSLSENLHVKADVVEATKASVNIDDSCTELVLTIHDALGMQCSWCLPPDLADQLGNALMSKASSVKTIERQEN